MSEINLKYKGYETVKFMVEHQSYEITFQNEFHFAKEVEKVIYLKRKSSPSSYFILNLMLFYRHHYKIYWYGEII